MSDAIDQELIRSNEDDELLQSIDLEPRWDRLFQLVELMFTPDKKSFVTGMWRATLRGFLWQAKKRVAADPHGSRSYVVESMQAIAACLEVEPLELYPDLKRAPSTDDASPPKEPVVA